MVDEAPKKKRGRPRKVIAPVEDNITEQPKPASVIKIDNNPDDPNSKIATEETKAVQKEFMELLRKYGEKWESDTKKYPPELVTTMYMMIVLDCIVGAGGLAAVQYKNPVAFYQEAIPQLAQKSVPVFEESFKIFAVTMAERQRLFDLQRTPDEKVH